MSFENLDWLVRILKGRKEKLIPVDRDSLLRLIFSYQELSRGAKMDFKCWYQSRAMWGALIAFASGVANLTGHQIAPDDQQALIEVLSGITAMAGGLLALWGRFHATSRIGAPPKEEQ